MRERKFLSKQHPELANELMANGIPAVPLSIKNFPKFIPLVEKYGKKLLQRIPVLTHEYKNSKSKNIQSIPFLCRKKLWELSDVTSLLNPDEMLSLRIYEPQSLNTFLKQSKGPSFLYEKQFGRILAVEMAARLTKVC